MPRYHFALYDEALTIDEEGLELPDLFAAWSLAAEIATKIACAEVSEGHLNLDHWIEIMDESREVVEIIRLSEVVTVSGRNGPDAAELDLAWRFGRPTPWSHPLGD